MNRLGTLLLTVALVAALTVVPLGATASDHNETAATETAAPGEQLAGVVGVQSAELDGDLDDRTYGVKIARAETDAAKADVVDDRLAEIEQRLAEHEAEHEELRAEREAGTISEGTYRAKVATVAAKQANTERAAQRAGDTASELPESVLSERNISVEAIEELRRNASELGGPETAAIAREIAGENVSRPVAEDRPPMAGDRPGPSDDEPSGTETTTDDDQDGETVTNGNESTAGGPADRSGGGYGPQ